MMNNNWNGNGPRPLSRKKTVRLMVALTILAWATQTLFHQWGYSQTIDGANEQRAADAAPKDEAEKFVPGSSKFAVGATLEFRSEATVIGSEVKLKQLCRWCDAEAGVFAPIADLVVARVGAKAPFRAISLQDLKTQLHDAGVNIAAINIVGATSCTVTRSDTQLTESEALQQWVNAKQGKADEVVGLPDAGGDADAASEQAPATKPAKTEPKSQFRSLRDQLAEDISTRLMLAGEKFQMTYRPQDEKLLALSEPHFNFQISPVRVRNLGDVAWNVTIIAEDGSTQRATIEANARAWQEQLIVSKPLSCKQLITESDVVTRRVLVERLSDETLLEKSQAIGQQAARDLKPGMILTGRMVDAVQLIKPGQFVTVTFKQDGVELKSVARALDSGSLGQAIRVKNEATKDIFQVTLTGPQTASMSSTN